MLAAARKLRLVNSGAVDRELVGGPLVCCPGSVPKARAYCCGPCGLGSYDAIIAEHWALEPSKWSREFDGRLERWDLEAKPPLELSMPQLGWLDHRWNPFFCLSVMYPRSLSCCAPIGCCLCCPGMHTVDVASPETFVPVMLGVADEHNLCPEELRGLLWMEYNIAAETLITFEDVEWRRNPNVEWDGLLGFKGNGNRTTDASCAGTCLTLFSTRDGGVMRFSTSPSGRWIAIPLDASFIYVPQPGDKFTYQGKEVELEPGDLIRVSYPKWEKTTELTQAVQSYAYVVRKLATRAPDGSTAYTKHYDRFQEWSEGPWPHPPLCGFFLCHLSGEQRREDITRALNRYQVLMFPPAPRAAATMHR